MGAVAAGIRFWRKLLKKLRPPRRVFPTRPGWFALCAPFVLGMAAINAGNNLLFLLLGACLGAICISGLMSEKALLGIQINLSVLGTIRAGTRGRFWLHVKRTVYELGDNPSFGLVVRERRSWSEERQSLGLMTALIPKIDGNSGRFLASRNFSQRGRVKLRALELSTIYPFGLIRKSKDLESDTSLIVRPKAVALPASLISPGGMTRGDDRSRDRGQGTELYGLRERREQDFDNRIHVKRSLALGKPVVIETEDMERPQAWLGVCNSIDGDAQAFERCLEFATEAVIEWTKQGHAVGVILGGRVLSPHEFGVEDILDQIALAAQNKSERSTSKDRPKALWLIPDGGLQAADDEAFFVVSAAGTLSS